jgi:hypothetical protein
MLVNGEILKKIFRINVILELKSEEKKLMVQIAH